MTKKLIILAVLLTSISAWAGDLTVDNLSVEQDASFYGAVNAYVPGGDVSMGPFTNQYGSGSGTNTPSLIPGTCPVGAIQMYASATAPSCWLLCNGAAVSRTTYSNLFSVIGASYGAGDGTNTFNVPDLRQRFALGSTNSLGTTGGVSSVTLSTNQIPAHTHNMRALFSGTDQSTDGYPCNLQRNNNANQSYPKAVESSGGGQPHTNMPPYLIVNFIIYAGQ